LLHIIFHGTGNLARFFQNFGISGGEGVEPPKPSPLGTPVHGGTVRTTETGKAIMDWTGGYNGKSEASIRKHTHNFVFTILGKILLEIFKKNCRITY
jgi:hypothetical protein